nr:MAG: TIGR02444 family protein [Hyphomicrobiales bacterium]
MGSSKTFAIEGRLVAAKNSNLDHPFWRYSLAVYSKDGVPQELIALQDTFDIDVNVALFCLWLGASAGLQLSEDQLTASLSRCRQWNIETVIPMRGVRRYLKSGTAVQPIAERAAELRTHVKRLELLAEQIEQAILYDWFVGQRLPPSSGSPAKAEENLTLFMRRSTAGWDMQRTREVFATTLNASAALEHTT